jgi:hypothetical protein
MPLRGRGLSRGSQKEAGIVYAEQDAVTVISGEDVKLFMSAVVEAELPVISLRSLIPL